MEEHKPSFLMIVKRTRVYAQNFRTYRGNLCIRQNVKETKQQEKDFLQNNKKGTNKRSSQSYEEVSFMWWACTSTKKKTFISFIFNLLKLEVTTVGWHSNK